jgi:hypothetical protein
MSFSDEFILPETQSMTSIARQVGNAVPPLLARRIADALAASLQSGDGQTEPQLFADPPELAYATLS